MYLNRLYYVTFYFILRLYDSIKTILDLSYVDTGYIYLNGEYKSSYM